MQSGELLYILIIILAITYLYSSLKKQEAFGMSPGTMDQLASTRAESIVLIN
jgi:hypothetical protein